MKDHTAAAFTSMAQALAVASVAFAFAFGPNCEGFRACNGCADDPDDFIESHGPGYRETLKLDGVTAPAETAEAP